MNNTKPSTNKRPPSGGHKKSNALLKKEQEFLELNAALEEKTTSLLHEAEAVLREQESLLSTSNSSAGLGQLKDRNALTNEFDVPSTQLSSQSSKKTIPGATKVRPAGKSSGKTQSNAAPHSRPASASSRQRPPSGGRARSASDKGPVKSADIDTDVIEERVTLANAISTIEAGMADEYYTPSKVDDGTMPTGAEEMGDEAVIRFLKAKLRVMQEELDKIIAECHQKDAKMDELNLKVKELTTDYGALQKSKSSIQNENERLKKQTSDMKGKQSELEQQISALKKETDGLKREQKQNVNAKNAVDVRLNRALEEVEKYKSSLQKAKESTKDSNDQDRKRMDHLITENKKLEKQRNELLVAFKKQMKLIDVLKRQKMHIEAAKMLQFTEEEFVKALDWGR